MREDIHRALFARDASRCWRLGYESLHPKSRSQNMGMTVEQANSVPPTPDGEVVGRWRDSSLPGRVLTVVRRDDQLIERWDYADGSNSEDSLEESQLPDGRLRLEDQGGNANGDYYVVETDGRLGLYDGDGRWSLLQRE